MFRIACFLGYLRAFKPRGNSENFSLAAFGRIVGRIRIMSGTTRVGIARIVIVVDDRIICEVRKEVKALILPSSVQVVAEELSELKR